MASSDKVVPPRNDFKKAPVFVKATINDQAGARPGFRRQWFDRKDPLSPLYYENYLDRHRVTAPGGLHAVAEGWTVVERKDAKPGRKRDDDTAGVETAQTHGDLVLMETTEENFAIYEERDRLRDQDMARKLGKGDDEAIRGEDGRVHSQYRARVSTGTDFVDQDQLLKGDTNG